MLNENYNQVSGSGKWNSFFLVLFVIVMAGANLWMIQKAFSNDTENLPKLKINVFSASSFVIKNTKQPEETALFSETKNILVLGKSGGNYIAPNLTDTIFIIHIDGPAKKIKIISIPRDLAVKIPNNVEVTKINSLYQIGLKKSEQEGLNVIKNKAEEVTGIKINSFAIFDLDSVEKIIDEIGGINVFVKETINDIRFPTPNGGYEVFKLEKGMRYLDGKTALKFIRTRNTPGGDFDRIARQQQVLIALKGKLLSLNPIWNFGKIWSIFTTIQQNLRTDLSLTDMKNIWSLAKNIDLGTIKTFSINTDSGLIVNQKMILGGTMAHTLVAKPKPFEYANIKSEINNFLIK